MNDNFPELDVEAALPIESDLALTNFVSINPHFNGAHWADVVSILGDADANLEITEPIHEALDAAHACQDAPPHVVEYVTLTLFYAHKRPPSPFDVQGKVEAVAAWVAANPKDRHSR